MKTITVALLLLSISIFANPLQISGDLFQDTTPKDSISFCINTVDSFGIFNSQLTKDDLVKLFGKENVGEKSEWREEGTVEVKITAVYPETKNEVALSWKEDGTLANILLKNPDSDWVVNGLKVGMTLTEIEKVNTNNFMFYGFGWDNGGTIYNWENGIFANSLENIKVSLELDWENIGNKNIDKFMGDTVKLNSNNEKIKEFGISIYSITVKY
jgi:hypothetical protein